MGSGTGTGFDINEKNNQDWWDITCVIREHESEAMESCSVTFITLSTPQVFAFN